VKSDLLKKILAVVLLYVALEMIFKSLELHILF
jgi:uncharacterized membrane protein YfcA